MCTASVGKLGRNEARTGIGLVSCSQTGETTVLVTHKKEHCNHQTPNDIARFRDPVV